MDERTTIAIPARVRDRLRQYGPKTITYAEILDELMDRISPRDFLAEGPFVHTRVFPDVEVGALRRQSVTERLRVAEGLRLMAVDVERARTRGQ